jgi:hypothetical protein
MSAPAFADLYLEAYGEPASYGSWSQLFQLKDTADDPHGFDKLELEMVSGLGNLESPWMSIVSGAPADFTFSGSASAITAMGTDTASSEPLWFDLYFAGAVDQKVAFNLSVYDLAGGSPTLSGTVGAIWQPNAGGQWKWTTKPQESVVLNPHGEPVFVPIPAAVLLGMIGLTAAGLKLRRFA